MKFLCFVFLVERLHTKLATIGHTVFANSLWSYYMLNKDFDKASSIVKDLSDAPYVQYRHLLSDIRSNNNIELGYKLIETIPMFKHLNQNSNLGVIFSAIIDAHG